MIRTQGSHHRLRHADGRVTTVPVHAGETIGPGLLASILIGPITTPVQAALAGAIAGAVLGVAQWLVTFGSDTGPIHDAAAVTPFHTVRPKSTTRFTTGATA